MSKPIVGYWDVRGIGQAIRHLLVYLDVDFVDKRYKTGNEGADWFNEKYSHGFEFPNLPYLIDGDHKITQSLAILRYLSRKYHLDGSSTEERLRISLIEQQVADLNIAFWKLAMNPNVEKLKPEFISNLSKIIKPLADYLGDEPFVAGSNISYVDFYLYEYLVKIKIFVNEVFEQFPNLKRYVGRIESLPRLSSYIKKQAPVAFGGPACLWNAYY